MLSFSPSRLNELKCARCFVLAEKYKCKHPRGAFPSLPGGMDRVLKGYLDQFRGSLPPELTGQVPGVLYSDLAKLNKWRNWRSGLSCIVEVAGVTVKLSGAIDDLLYDETTGTYSPYDLKTKGQAIKDDGAVYYQQQLNSYSLLFRENGLPPSGRAFLHYVWPEAVNGLTVVKFSDQVCELVGDADAALVTLERAVKILQGPMPAPSADCDYCQFAIAYQRISVAYENTGDVDQLIPDPIAVPAESAT